MKTFSYLIFNIIYIFSFLNVCLKGPFSCVQLGWGWPELLEPVVDNGCGQWPVVRGQRDVCAARLGRGCVQWHGLAHHTQQFLFQRAQVHGLLHQTWRGGEGERQRDSLLVRHRENFLFGPRSGSVTRVEIVSLRCLVIYIPGQAKRN